MEAEIQMLRFPDDAFIRYSTQNRDFTSRVEKALERYKHPKDL